MLSLTLPAASAVPLFPAGSPIGGGYEPLPSDAANAVRHVMATARSIGVMDWAAQQIELALQQPCVKGREVFRDSGAAEIRRQMVPARP